MDNLCIIPARGGSKRIPRKNIKQFINKPIIAYSIEVALESELFKEVMVSTEDEEIAAIAEAYGAKVPFLRSEKNANDFATTVDVLLEVIDTYAKRSVVFTNACCIYPTAPFITMANLKKGYTVLNEKKYDSVFPIVPFESPVQRAIKKKNDKGYWFYPEYRDARSQDMEVHYHDVGQFYWFRVESLVSNKALTTPNTGVFEIPRLYVQDIDDMQDWDMAEFKYQYLKKNEAFEF